MRAEHAAQGWRQLPLEGRVASPLEGIPVNAICIRRVLPHAIACGYTQVNRRRKPVAVDHPLVEPARLWARLGCGSVVDWFAADLVVGVEQRLDEQGADVGSAEAVDDSASVSPSLDQSCEAEFGQMLDWRRSDGNRRSQPARLRQRRCLEAPIAAAPESHRPTGRRT